MNINLDNQIVSYSDNTREAKYTLVFIHGNSSCKESFRFQVCESKIAENYRVIALDLPGHGESERFSNPEEYCLDGYVKIIVDFIKKLELKNLILIGHSLGGHICIESAPKIKHLKGIVIFQTPPINSLETIDAAFSSISEGIPYKSEFTEQEISKYCCLISQSHQDEIRDWFEKTDSLAREFLGKSVSASSFSDEVSILNGLKIPKAIFHGENDLLINKDYMQRIKIQGLWNNEQVVIPNTTHSPQLESPSQFNQTLMQFMQLFD